MAESVERSMQLEEALLAMDREAMRAVLEAGLEEGLQHAELADRIIGPALERIGEGWEAGDIALSQVYMAGRMLEEVVATWFKPILNGHAQPLIGLGVLGDHHALGKRIVLGVLTSAGRKIVDFGAGLSAEDMARRALEESVDVLMVSVLMYNRALKVKQLRTLLDEAGRSDIPIVVGGAPFVHDPDLWRRVGADACGVSAADALRLAGELTGGGK